MPSHRAKSKKHKSLPKPRKIFSIENLRYIWKNSGESDKKTSGVDGEDVKKFNDNLDTNITEISKVLIEGRYLFNTLRPSPILKDNGKHRIICVPTVRDRLVQRLILHLLTVPKDRLHVVNEISYGTRKGHGTGTEAAINRAIKLREKSNWVLKTDITAFFDKISRPELISTLEKRLKKTSFNSLLPLLKQIVNCEIFIYSNKIRGIVKNNNIENGRGLRQGMPLSPLLSNVFLNQFDRFVQKKALNIVRYVDDIIVLCNSEAECHAQKEIIEQALNAVRLTIPSLECAGSKTQIIKPNDPVEFLGMEIYKHNTNKYSKRIPQKKIDAALFKLEQYSDYQYALKKSLNYHTLLNKLDNKHSGYKAAYKDATNLDEFLNLINSKSQIIVNELLVKILGKNVLNSLSDDKKIFLGIKWKSFKSDA